MPQGKIKKLMDKGFGFIEQPDGQDLFFHMSSVTGSVMFNDLREGQDVTIVSLGLGVHQALSAAETLAAQGVNAEVVDLVSLVPLDRDTIRESVAKTGRLIVVDEDYMSYGVSGEVIASVTEHDISVLKASPKRIAYPDVPIPYARVMEQYCLPSADKIVAAWDQMKAA